MPAGFHLLIAAQFASALADNALLIVTIALLQQQGLPGWWAPMLKFGFTLSYVVFAPLVGALADAVPKARLMACMNAVKAAGVVALLFGLHPMAAFTIVGLGAAAYAPAKYGLITELVPPERLVVANGWIEISVVCAALLGTVLGGLLVSPWMQGLPVGMLVLALAEQAVDLSDTGWLSASLLALLGVYGVAGMLNVSVPASGAQYPACGIHPLHLTRVFWRANRTLWRDADGGLSLAVTTIFWGIGATLQFAVLRWAAEVLKLPLDQAAYLQGAVAVGVIVGAAAAARWVPLTRAKRVLGAGVVLGLMMPLIASASALPWAVAGLVAGLVAVGVVGGILVVPLNALLQHRGHTLLSAGRSVAVQGFNENASVLGMLAVYALLIALDVSIVSVLWGFGLSVAAVIALLMWRERQQVRQRGVSALSAPVVPGSAHGRSRSPAPPRNAR